MNRFLILAGVVALAIGIPADLSAQKKTVRKKAVTKKAPAKKLPAPKILPEYKDLPIIGAYTLRPGNGKENFAIRVVFRQDGSWIWVGPNFKSEGRYWYKPNYATLDYRSIDGAPQKPGTVRAKITFLDNNRAFVLDNRVFGKKGTPDYVPAPPATTPETPPPATPPPSK